MTVGSFSAEYIYRECNCRHHCLCAVLKKPILLPDGCKCSCIYILEVLLDVEAEELMVRNICNGHDCNDCDLVLKVSTDNIPIEQAVEVTLNVSNIESVEFVKF